MCSILSILRRASAVFRTRRGRTDGRIAWHATAARVSATPRATGVTPAARASATANWTWSATQPGDLRFANDALGRVVLNYAPVLDRRYAVMGTRLTVHALAPIDLNHIDDLLRVISEVWPEEAGHRVSLNMADDALARLLLQLRPARNILIEVPATLTLERPSRQHLQELQANGNLLQLKDHAAHEIPPDVFGYFQYIMAGLSEPVEAAAGRKRPMPDLVRSDIRSLNGMQTSFASGAVAITGWPMATSLQAAQRRTLRTGSRTHVITELLRRINQGAPSSQLEQTLAQDPTLAYKLLRFVNSASFNLPVKMATLRDALAMLGRHKLNRWLVLTLAAEMHADLRPTTFAAMRRGAMMEELARLTGHCEWSDELFICGIFSLIDRMLGESMRSLLAAISAPSTIARTLTIQSGPYVPYLRLARLVENGPFELVRQSAKELDLNMASVNRALLQATANAVELGQY